MLNVIEAIEEKLQAQKDDIFFKDIQIKELKERLETAEAEKKALTAKIDTLIKRVEAEAGKNPVEAAGIVLTPLREGAKK